MLVCFKGCVRQNVLQIAVKVQIFVCFKGFPLFSLLVRKNIRGNEKKVSKQEMLVIFKRFAENFDKRNFFLISATFFQ